MTLAGNYLLAWICEKLYVGLLQVERSVRMGPRGELRRIGP